MDGMTTLGRADGFPIENYTKDTLVWIRDNEKVWKTWKLVDKLCLSKPIAALVDEDGELIEYDVAKHGLPFLKNPDILRGKNDLTNLSYLHEPGVLYNLNYRFEKMSAIYTYCGIVLVAINPYSDCSSLYGDDVIQVYRGVGKQVKGLDPHIYAISEEAYFDMCEYGKNQSIIVSGESGAGKTVSAKFVMRYLATVASAWNGNSTSGETGIEKKVLATNPIMEAIGNAKTIRNDNSSRFGKFIKINFSDRRVIVGAEMQTYLLETSRVVFQANDERNYHIFYQMCESKDHPFLENLRLNDIEDYNYLYGGECANVDTICDKKDFGETLDALTKLGISEEVQRKLFKIFAAVLVMGNLQYNEVSDSVCQLAEDTNLLQQLCDELLAVDSDSLKLWLTAREIRCGKEVMRKPLSKVEALVNKDALAKLLYSSLFNWIVDQINLSLSVERNGLEKVKSPVKGKKFVHKFIGVLDIYGFETFETNSFEQFCINYANEKLQQQFNQHVFKLEQEEYVKEGIEWVRIDFYDNQPCIDLIENRPGIIDYLDEQCKIGRGTDEDWLRTLSNCKIVSKNDNFRLPKISDPSFIVKHFAADVQYKVDGFIEKNKNTINEQLLEVVKVSKCAFVREILLDATKNSAVGNERKKTVSFKFRESLKELITVLTATRPHYVRCIKPNDVKESFYMEPMRSIQQLRACGVLETVRLSAAGYPSRMGYEDFSRRYRVLYTADVKLWKTNAKQFADLTCRKHLEVEKFALGKTKMFFRTGQVATLERLRHERMSEAALTIQCCWRRYLAYKIFKARKSALLIIQASLRAFLAFRRIKYLQMERAATCIQTTWRTYIARKMFQNLKRSAVMLQSIYRGNVVRRRFIEQRYNRSVLTIQRYARGYLVRKANAKRIRRIVRIQCRVRVWLAKRRLRELKIEAKSVGHLQDLNKGLENKIFTLQQKLDVANSQVHVVKRENKQIDSMKEEMKKMELEIRDLLDYRKRYDALKLEMVAMEETVNSRDVVIATLQVAVKDKDELQVAIEKEKTKVGNLQEQLLEKDAEIDRLKRERAELRSELVEECSQRLDVERQIEDMRDQLMSNADLLGSGSSPSLSRHPSVRSDITNSETPSRKNLNSTMNKEEYDIGSPTNNKENNDDHATVNINKLVAENLRLQEKIKKDEVELASLKLSRRDSNLEEPLCHEIIPRTGYVQILDMKNFVNKLLYGLKNAALNVIEPKLPAHIIFGALRLYDKDSDESGFTECFTHVDDGIKEMLGENSSFEIVLFWLTSSVKLLNLMRQYSVDNKHSKKEWFEKNTGVQMLQRLQKIEGHAFRKQLESRIESGYQCLLKKHVEPVLIPKIVPAILMHDATKSTSSGDKGLAGLLTYLTSIVSSLKAMSADEDLIKQIFCQLIQWSSSLALNHMMFRKDLCTFEKAFVIKHNVVELEQWLKTNKFAEFSHYLNPLIQACHLLQSQKTTSNIDTLSGEMTDDLKPRQILSILKHYTPSIDFEEEEPSADFLVALEVQLNKRENGNKESIMPGGFVVPLDVSKFVYSDVDLKSVTLPSCLRLGKACKLV
uniref:Myosin motor domain-containing protein n=1 Tax=Rhabditophanes sp. KR3021 TaxID=114890 RepID=A0AC35UCJ3_9BILA